MKGGVSVVYTDTRPKLLHQVLSIPGFCIIIFQVRAQGIAELRLKLKNRWKAMTKILFSCEGGSH